MRSESQSVAVRDSRWHRWQWQVGNSLEGMGGLREVPGLDGASVAALEPVVRRYPFRVTPYYASLVDGSDPGDPLRLQFIPDRRELDTSPGVSGDPFEESRYMPVRGLVHRFPDRVLIIAGTVCGMACRHCTRKNTLRSAGADLDGEGWARILEYIGEHDSVREVIVSGGDPLLLADAALDRLLGSLHAVPNVEVVRLGTRMPVVCPMRVTDELAEMLGSHRPLWVNTQFNHVRELTQEAVDACRRMVLQGIPVSNQSVLLRGINDSVEAMEALCRALQRNLVRPYYVFVGDPVEGTAHFRTGVQEAADLSRALSRRNGGLSMPRFVVDVPGAPAKVDVERVAAAHGGTKCFSG